MIVSVHDETRGGFDYYEAAGSVPINDDFPTPEYNSVKTELGVPASRAGRPMPAGARMVGHGPMARGTVSTGKPGLWLSSVARAGDPSGMGDSETGTTMLGMFAILVAAGIMALVFSGGEKPHDRERHD